MKIYIKNIILLTIGLLILNSCQKFLTEDPKGQIVAQNAFSTQADLDGTLNVLYSKIQRAANGTDCFANAWMGDDITAFTGGNKEKFREFDRYHVTDVNGSVGPIWKTNYQIIKAANYIISGYQRTNTTTELKNIAGGQGYFWRAYAYYKLVRVFGKLPLIKDNNFDNDAKPSETKDIYQFIVSDLEEAIKMLPDKFSKPHAILNDLNVYANSGAAKAVLTSVYLSMAGYPLNQTEYYAKAADLAKELINDTKSGKYYYILEPEYGDRFKYVTNNYSKENVIGIRFNTNNPWSWSGLDSWNCVTQGYDKFQAEGWSDLYATVKYYVNMPEGARKDAIYGKNGGKIYYVPGKKLVDWYAETSIVPKNEDPHPMFRTLLYGSNSEGQQVDYDSNGPFHKKQTCNQTICSIAYSEVLLWYAEAAARANKFDDLANECLLKVMTRAYGADKANELLSNANTNEKKAELALREHGYEVAGYYPAYVSRASDMLRMNLFKDYFAERKANKPITYLGRSFAEQVKVEGEWNDSRNYAPFPNRDASLNKNLK